MEPFLSSRQLYFCTGINNNNNKILIVPLNFNKTLKGNMLWWPFSYWGMEGEHFRKKTNLEGLIQELCLGMFPHLHLPYANGHQSLSLLLFKYPNSLHPHCHCSVQDGLFYFLFTVTACDSTTCLRYSLLSSILLNFPQSNLSKTQMLPCHSPA